MATIESQGARLIAVAPAAPYQAAKLEKKLGVALYLDSDRRLREVLELHRPGLLEWIFNVRGWLRYLGGLIRARRQGWITGHYSNVPAVAVLDASGDIEYLKRGRSMGDYPPLSDVLTKLQSGNS